VQGGTLEVAVRADGVGFDVDARRRQGLGLVGMGERAALAGGQLEIESAPGAGTICSRASSFPKRARPELARETVGDHLSFALQTTLVLSGTVTRCEIPPAISCQVLIV
jgi:hypothetical protein